MTRPSVTVQRSGSAVRKNLEASLKALRQTDVLVGIPADKAMRKGDEMNNSTLLYILSKGSPLRNLPPRPVVEPGIEKSKDIWTPELAAAAQAMMEQKPGQATLHLKRAGVIASNAVKRMFGSSDLAPNAPSTIRKKKSDRPLIDTGILRRSITYVLRQGRSEPIAAQETAAVEPQRAVTGSIASDVGEAATLGGEAIEAVL